jgi:hypothetical protein
MKFFGHPSAGAANRRSAEFLKFLLAGICLVAPLSQFAATFIENFSGNPSLSGWQTYGNTNLFQWDSTNQNLTVTWDSTQTNSYFCHSLGTILAKSDAFNLSFDLQLNDIAWTGSPELAVGLFRYSDATNTTFSRPAANTPNLFEFDYFPDNGAGQPAIVGTLTDTNVSSTNKKDFFFAYDNLLLNAGISYHVVLTHDAGQTNITGQIFTNGQPYTSLLHTFRAPISDFRIDTVSVNSYANPGSALLAHGTVDNFIITLPPPPVQNFSGKLTNSLWQAQFLSQSNWLYTVQRTTNLVTWINASVSTNGNGTNLFLLDTNPPLNDAFYRVEAKRP